ncbi:MAG: DUF1697 domain-containing protein [Sphingomicrobium sp.]
MPSAELKAIGEACGFCQVKTFIASGNLLFVSDRNESEVAVEVASGVERYFSKPVAVLVRSAADLAEIVSHNPFPEDPGNRVVVFFLPRIAKVEMVDAATGGGQERIALRRRELYIAYGEGMADSKLKLPVFREGTGRNINSVSKMAALLADLE